MERVTELFIFVDFLSQGFGEGANGTCQRYNALLFAV